MADNVRFATVQDDREKPGSFIGSQLAYARTVNSGFNGFPFPTPSKARAQIWDYALHKLVFLEEETDVVEWDGTTFYEVDDLVPYGFYRTFSFAERIILSLPSASTERLEKVVGNSCGILKVPIEKAVEWVWKFQRFKVDSANIDVSTYGLYLGNRWYGADTTLTGPDVPGTPASGARERKLAHLEKDMWMASNLGKLFRQARYGESWEGDPPGTGGLPLASYGTSGSNGTVNVTRIFLPGRDPDNQPYILVFPSSDIYTPDKWTYSTLSWFTVAEYPGFVYIPLSDLILASSGHGESSWFAAEGSGGSVDAGYSKSLNGVFYGTSQVSLTRTFPLGNIGTLIIDDYEMAIPVYFRMFGDMSFDYETYIISEGEVRSFEISLKAESYWPYAVQDTLPDGSPHPNAGLPIWDTTTGDQLLDPVTGL